MDKIEIVRALLCEDSGGSTETPAVGPWQVGGKYLIRLVTHYWTGRVVRVDANEIVLADASWIADTGRFSDALSSGKLNEIEPVDGPVIINRAAVVDAVVWRHDLPRSQK